MGLWFDLKDWLYRTRITIVRRTLAFGIFLLLNSLLWGMISFGNDPLLRYVLLPNASCRYIDNAPTYCYYYPLQNWLTGGWQTYYLDMVLPMLIIVAMIVAFGRTWCSWACPFGLFQELITSIRSAMKVPHLTLHYKWISLLDQLKYAMLFFTLLVSVALGVPFLGLEGFSQTYALPFCQLCPAKPVFTLLQMAYFVKPLTWTAVPSWLEGLPLHDTYVVKALWSLWAMLPWLAWAMLAFFLIGSFFIRMFWCRLCPMGAFIALFNSLSLVWLRKDPKYCTKCRICLRVCPQDYYQVYEEMEKENITGGECTIFGRCVESCPEKDALSLVVLNKTIISSKPKK